MVKRGVCASRLPDDRFPLQACYSESPVSPLRFIPWGKVVFLLKNANVEDWKISPCETPVGVHLLSRTKALILSLPWGTSLVSGSVKVCGSVSQKLLQQEQEGEARRVGTGTGSG